MRRAVPASATPSASASRASYAIPIPTASPCSTSNFAVASIAWPTVWPKLRIARRPASRSSAATTSALISTDRRTSLSTTSGGAACLATVGHSRSRKAKYSRSAITPCLTASAMPAASCAGASEPRASRSATTSRGWWNAPSRFFPAGTSTADLDALGSLAPAQLAAGMAEAVKHGVIADREYFAFLERECPTVAKQAAPPDVVERLVRRSVEIKAEVVAADEREAGRRAILNFGHTVGHAIEATAKFDVLHGEAVGIGMAYEARLAEALGVAEAGTARRIRGLLEGYGLPVELPDTATVDGLVAAMQLDKKTRDGTVRFALPRAVGVMCGDRQAGWTVTAPERVVREVLGRGKESAQTR